jgi:arylsulfatase A-like enzyme
MFDRGARPNMYQLAGEVDRAIGNLVGDLKTAGRLRDTLIVLMGEFGRTPGALNSRGGRDHHKDAQSVLLIGGGVAGGQAIGATDAEGSRIIDPGWSRGRPIYMEDVTATVYSAMGVDWTKSLLNTPSGRKFEFVPGADRGSFVPVNEVFGA